MLKQETEENITEYLKDQGVTACKRFKVRKDGNLINTNTLLLTFDTTSLPKSLKIVYRIYQLKFTFQILCSVLTVRGLDIMKTTVLSLMDPFVKNAVVPTTIHIFATTQSSV